MMERDDYNCAPRNVRLVGRAARRSVMTTTAPARRESAGLRRGEVSDQPRKLSIAKNFCKNFLLPQQ